MKIGIDAKFASPRYGGLGTYTIAIIKALVDLGRDDIIAFAPEGWGYDLHLPPPSERFAVRAIAADKRAPADFFAFRVHWEQTILPTALERHAIDVFFGPAFMAPVDWPGPRVVTVHDLLFERSDRYNPAPSTAYYRAWARRCAEASDAIVSISHTTAADVRDLWGLGDIPLWTIPLASTLPFVPRDRATAAAQVHAALHIDEPYILYVGNTFPRKNVERLVAAYGHLDEGLRRSTRLVLVTAPDMQLDAVLARHDVAARTVVTGYCAADLLPHIYAAAELLVFPSLFEGFGLPALEALACGTPVVCSRTSSLPEVVGDAAVLIDPMDVGSIAAAMARLLTDASLRADLAARGRARARLFSWARAGRETRDILAWAWERRQRPITGPEGR